MLHPSSSNTSPCYERGGENTNQLFRCIAQVMHTSDNEDVCQTKSEEPACMYKNPSTGIRIYRVHDKEHKLGGETAYVAVKALAHPSPDPGEVSRLYDEYILSRHLSKCSAVRDALMQMKIQGSFHAICLEWAPGVTMSEWTTSFHRGRKHVVDWAGAYRGIVCLALEVTRSVSEIHQMGVVHNNLSSENLIVDGSIMGVEQERKSFSVKIIDFGSASLVDEKNSVVDCTRKDMISLGVILYELFSGKNILHKNKSGYASGYSAISSHGNEPRVETKKIHVASDAPVIPLHLLECNCENLQHRCRVPLSISNLVSNLMEIEPFDRYQSLREVADDLNLMYGDPNRFLYDIDPERVTGKLEIPRERLYGRSQHLSILMDAYSRVILEGGSSEMVLVSGKSGTGKTVLVEKIREPLVNNSGYFISGKFDKLHQVEPLSAIIAAFTEYCEKVVAGGTDNLQRTRTVIQSLLSSESAVLTNLIPGLHRIIGGSESSLKAAKVGGMEAQNRLKLIFRMFVRGIATPSHPIVLFLDDLQWADVASLELIRALVTDIESKCVLFIGSFRDNEVHDAHPLVLQLREIEKHNVVVTNIKVQNISRDEVNNLVSDTLRVPRRLSWPLTDVVFQKTDGNAFFVIQFLKFLVHEGDLSFSFESRMWRWHLDAIRSKIIADNGVEFMAGKILQQSDGVRDALKLVACLGFQCEESILHLIADDKPEGSADKDRDEMENYNRCNNLAQMLDVAVQNGLMDRIGSRYKFAHDQIQCAAYSLIAEEQRAMMHLHIGNRMKTRATETELEEVLFVAVDQLDFGIASIKDSDEKIELAKLNLRAGEKAMSLALFLPAAVYLNLGISLLGQEHWEKHYVLTLQLHNACVEAQYCNANYDEMGQLLDEILKYARVFDDKLRAYSTFVNGLGVRGKLQEAVQMSLVVLEQLGEDFPDSESANSHVFQDWLRTKDMLEGFTDEDITALHVMTNHRKIAAMQFLDQFGYHSALTVPQYIPLIAFRMVQLSLTYGVCKESANGFALYGLVLNGHFGYIKRAHDFGQFALALLDRFSANDCLARVYIMVHGLINPWSVHIRLSLEPFLRGHQVGLRSGDIEFALKSFTFYCMYSIMAGKYLPSVEKDLRTLCLSRTQYRQDTQFLLTLPIWQTVLNIMGRSYDPTTLTGEAMDQDQMLKDARDKNIWNLTCRIFFFRTWLAYLYCDYELAAEMAKNCVDIGKLFISKFEVCEYTFYSGLISLKFARTSKKMKWIKLAEKSTEKMKNWAEHAPCNCHHKLALMEAETAFNSGEYGKAAAAYDAAIEGAGKHGFSQDRSLAYERAGDFYLCTGDEVKASEFYHCAHTCFLEWGARGKAEHLRARSLSLLISN